MKSADESEEEIIVSLTTHGRRIRTVYRSVESIFCQTVKANRVILYIGNKEFQNEDQLPAILQNQMKRGLEVRFVEDMGSCTKLLPAMRDFPYNTIITVDDDIWYPSDTIERLLRTHREHPNSICALAARIVKWKSKNMRMFRTFKDFPFVVNPTQDTTSNMYLAEGGSGVLYPPHSFTDEVYDMINFRALSPKADDLWFKAMGLISGTPVCAVKNYYPAPEDLFFDDDVQDMGLSNFNLDQKGNDKQWKALCDHYNLYALLKD